MGSWLMGPRPATTQPLEPQRKPPELIVCGFYGRVTNEQGQPIPGALIFYRAEGWSPTTEVRGGETDEDGVYVVKYLSPDQYYYVTVWAAGYQPAKVEGIVPKQNQPQEVNVSLRSGGQRFVGRVLDDETGKPLPEAQVCLAQALHNPMTPWRGFLSFTGLSVRCDPDGRYQLPCPEPGRYTLAAWVAEYDQAEVVCTADPEVPEIMVPADLRLRRSRFGTLHLTVLAPDGQTPVEGAKVFLDAGPLPGKGIGVKTAADGTAVLEQVNVNWPAVHFLTVWREDYAITVVEKVCVTEGQTTSCEVRMNPGVTLTGRVLDRRGQPASDRVVTARPITLRINDRPWPVEPYKRLFLTADTDEEGRFKVLHLAPGQWVVAASDKEEEVFTTSLQLVTVTADMEELSIDLREIR